jgi:hypothetical protein
MAQKLAIGEFVTKEDKNLKKAMGSEFAHRKGKGRKKVVVASLTLTMVPQEAYGTHCSNFYQLGRDCPEYDFAFVTPRRMAIDNMRNMVVELAIKGGFDYLYFFDDDTVNDKNVLGRLLPRMEEFNAVSAGYFVRGYPFNPMVFRWTDPKKPKKGFGIASYRDYRKRIDEDGVMREGVAGVGCGCTLFRVEDFKKVPYPWFYTGPHHTEDAWWFARAHEKIPNYKVGMDFNIVCGHLCNPVYVDGANVDVVRKFHRQLHKVGGLSQ